MASAEGRFYLLDNGGLALIEVVGSELSRHPLGWLERASLLDVSAPDRKSVHVLALGPRGVWSISTIDTTSSAHTQTELPPPLRTHRGVSGIASGPEGELWVELEGGSRVAMLTADGAEIRPGYPYPEGLYQVGQPAGSSSLRFASPFASVTLEAASDVSAVGASLLGVNPDGSFVIVFSETRQQPAGTLAVSQRAQWYGRDGTLLGVTSFPSQRQFLHVAHPATLTDSGEVYYLLTQQDEVLLLQLPWRTP